MRTLILIAVAGCVFGQQRMNPAGHQPPTSVGQMNPLGQGNILHPGVPNSGPPRVHPHPNNGAGFRNGGVSYIPYGVAIDPFYTGYAGGYGTSGFYAPPPGQYDPIFGIYNPGGQYAPTAPAPAAQSPTVIINQNFLPDTAHPVLHDYTNTPVPPNGSIQAPPQGAPAQAGGTAQSDDRPTIFLIAMKDHTIYPVIAYWVDKDTLNYVTVESAVKRVPMDQVDRDLSRQLNEQRNVEFKLPAPAK